MEYASIQKKVKISLIRVEQEREVLHSLEQSAQTLHKKKMAVAKKFELSL